MINQSLSGRLEEQISSAFGLLDAVDGGKAAAIAFAKSRSMAVGLCDQLQLQNLVARDRLTLRNEREKLARLLNERGGGGRLGG